MELQVLRIQCEEEVFETSEQEGRQKINKTVLVHELWSGNGRLAFISLVLWPKALIG